jgi:hypothetical protein
MDGVASPDAAGVASPARFTDDLAELDRNECAVCGQVIKSLWHHVISVHGISMAEYRQTYGRERFFESNLYHR